MSLCAFDVKQQDIPSMPKDEKILVRAKMGGYTGLYGFHKYWGKKPADVYKFLIEALSVPGDFIVDPFVGSGVLAVEAKRAGRRFFGADINPAAVHLSNLLVNPPQCTALKNAYRSCEAAVAQIINDSYRLENVTGVASHYLWNQTDLQCVWVRGTS